MSFEKIQHRLAAACRARARLFSAAYRSKGRPGARVKPEPQARSKATNQLASKLGNKQTSKQANNVIRNIAQTGRGHTNLKVVALSSYWSVAMSVALGA